MKQLIEPGIKKLFVRTFAQNAQVMYNKLKPTLELLKQFICDPIINSEQLQLLSGEPQYFYLYDRYAEDKPEMMIYALFSCNPEAIQYVMRAHPRRFASLSLHNPYIDIRRFFVIPKMIFLLDFVLDSIAKENSADKVLHHEITHLFIAIVTVNWWEGVEHLLKRHPGLWKYEMPSGLFRLSPMHYIAIHRFEWIEQKIATNPDLCELLNEKTPNMYSDNLAHTCAFHGSLAQIKWLFDHKKDMLSLEDWNLSKAIFCAGHNEKKEILSFLIDLLDQKIQTLSPQQLQNLLGNLHIQEPIKPSETSILRKHLLQKYWYRYDYIYAAWSTSNIPLLKTAIERSMTPDTWTIDESPDMELDSSDPVEHRKPQVFFELLEEYPALTNLIFLDASLDWSQRSYITVANLIYLNVITKLFQQYIAVFNNSHLPKELNQYIMAFALEIVQSNSGLHLVDTCDEDPAIYSSTKIEPVISSALIQLSFLKPAERKDKFYKLDFECADAGLRALK